MQEQIDKALTAFKNKDWNTAIDAFTSVIEVQSDNAEIYNNLALCYANVGDDKKAEQFYLKCIKLNPKIVQCYINLSDLYFRTKKYADGIGLLNTAISVLPNELILSHYLARFYMADSRWDMAIDELEGILSEQPDNYDAYYDLGRAHFELGNYQLALENFENILEYKNDNEYIYFYIAQACQGIYDIDKAISNYLKAIATNDKFYPAYKGLATMYMARADYEDAIEYFTEYCNFELPQNEKEHITKIINRLEKMKDEK